MRTIKLIFPALIFLISISSCRKDVLTICGAGNNVTETRNVSGFSGIELNMSANVYYLQDSIYKVEVNAQPNIQRVIETELRGNILKIDCRAILHVHRPITITVHSPDMNMIRLGGSGKMYAQNGITTGSLEVSLSGSGNISIQSITANHLNCKISGSGNMDILGGSVSDENFHISGSGNMDAVNVVSDTSEVSISGSGDIKLYVLKYLNASISGSGSVKYKGAPSVEIHISGSGNITHIN